MRAERKEGGGGGGAWSGGEESYATITLIFPGDWSMRVERTAGAARRGEGFAGVLNIFTLGDWRLGAREERKRGGCV